MHILKTPAFERWQKKAALADNALRKAVQEMQQGLIDADLGGGLVKKRVARLGEGKRGGYRTLLATNQEDKWFFLYGFAKNEKDNLSPLELQELQKAAQAFLRLSEADIGTTLEEVSYGEEEISQ